MASDIDPQSPTALIHSYIGRTEGFRGGTGGPTPQQMQATLEKIRANPNLIPGLTVDRPATDDEDQAAMAAKRGGGNNGGVVGGGAHGGGNGGSEGVKGGPGVGQGGGSSAATKIEGDPTPSVNSPPQRTQGAPSGGILSEYPQRMGGEFSSNSVTPLMGVNFDTPQSDGASPASLGTNPEKGLILGGGAAALAAAYGLSGRQKPISTTQEISTPGRPAPGEPLRLPPPGAMITPAPPDVAGAPNIDVASRAQINPEISAALDRAVGGSPPTSAPPPQARIGYDPVIAGQAPTAAPAGPRIPVASQTQINPASHFSEMLDKAVQPPPNLIPGVNAVPPEVIGASAGRSIPRYQPGMMPPRPPGQISNIIQRVLTGMRK